MKQLVLDLIPTPAPTLANFVAGRNREAHAALSVLTDSPPGKQDAKIIYLWGLPGCGKSHLIAALAAQASSEFAAALPPVESDWLGNIALDNVDRLNDDAQQALFNLINRLQNATGSVVATGPCAPRDLPIRRDLASRLASGLVFQLHPLSDTERAGALRVHAASRGFALRDEVITYLLRHARRDMPSLMSMLDALDKHSIETGREITLPMLKEISQPSLV